MSGTRKPHPSSDNFWSSSKKYTTTSISINSRIKEKEEMFSEDPSAIDESPEFYDPYSDLSLFLSKKVKQEMQHCGSSKKWSLKIQEELLSKIAPDFRKNFPQYRLGISALKKTWEKVAYYSQQIEEQKEAINQDGKLNLNFFIKENLKNFAALKTSGPLHPSHFAHQIAGKMSECIAAIDGVRPQFDQLTRMIWAMQRHLLTGENQELYHSPYDDYNKIDKLIVKTILEVSAKDPQIGFQELEHQVREVLHSLHELPSFSSREQMLDNISALLAEKLYATSSFHTRFLSEQKQAILHFIQRHTALYKKGDHAVQLSELVRRIIALYTLANGLPKDLSEQTLTQAIQTIYPLETTVKPELPQSIFAFIAAELVLMRSEEFCPSPTFVLNTLWSAYKEATLLPPLHGKDIDLLELTIWKSLSETEGLLEKLPYRVGQRIEEEIANILIENPTLNFSTLVRETVKFFLRTKELVQIKQWEEIDRKIQLWALQGDMLCRWIRLDPENTLLRLICQKWKSTSDLPHHTFVSEICQEYLKNYPELMPYMGQLSYRVWILYKYAWYALFSTNDESSFDRFLKWHSSSLLFTGQAMDHHHLVHQLEEIVRRTLPLIPFDHAQADAMLT